MILKKFTLPHDYEKEIALDSQVVIVSVFGKSSYLARSCKAEFFDKRLGHSIFKNTVFDDLKINEDTLCNIEGFYNPADNVIYLHLLGSYDTHSLIKIFKHHAELLDEKGFLTFWTDAKYKYTRALLFLFHISHIVIVTHPTAIFDSSYIELFKTLDNVRIKIKDHVKGVLDKVPGISKDWLHSGRFCSPKLLFYFESRPSILQNINSSEEDSTFRKLEHSIEDQVYRIFRKTRVIGNGSRNSLFTIPNNENFVFVEGTENPMKDWTTFCLNSLVNFCSNSSIIPTHCRYGFESLPDEIIRPYAFEIHDFNNFLFKHIDTAFAKSTKDVLASPVKNCSVYQLPTAKIWFDVANKLFEFLVMQPDTNETMVEFANLKNDLDVDRRFSEARCNKVYPLAKAAYQENLPTHYTKEYHESKIAHAISIFAVQARGPQIEEYIANLVKECDQFWKNGRQMCEVLSLLGNPCSLPLHKGGDGEPSINEPDESVNVDDLPTMEHSSGIRYVSTCNCGRHQDTREDPFSIREANHDFYQHLSEKCGCSRCDKILFPVFQPSTKDFKAAKLLTRPSKVAARKENTSSVNKDSTKLDTVQCPTQGLSLVYNISSSVCIATDMLLAEEQQENLHPDGSNNENENQLQKPSIDSLTPTSEKIIIRVTDVDANKEIMAYSDSDKSIVRQPSTTEYLPSMLHSESPPSLLPQFPSWSLVCLGPSSLYSHNLGLQEKHQPGFIAGSSYLLPWDVTVRLEHHVRERFWPTADPRNKAPQRRKKGTREFNVKIFVGVEYECPCGHRFMCSSADKILKATGSGMVRDNGSRVTNCDMPLYFPCPCRTTKPLTAQLMRVHIVTPKAPVNVTLNPSVQPAPDPCPVFVTGIQEPVRLSQSSYWVLRLPFVYCGDRGPYLPPKEKVPADYGRLLAGLYGISEVPPDIK